MRQRQTADDEPWYLWPRLHLEGALVEGASVTLPPEHSHYLKNVRRVTEGGRVRLFNARDGEFDAVVERVGKKELGVLLTAQRRTPLKEAPRQLALLFSLVKKEALDLVMVKAVELGATHLQPVITERTVVRGFNPERAQALAIEAAEQCERLSVPEIHAPLALAAAVKQWSAKAPLIAAIETTDPADTLHAHAHNWVGQDVALLVGPEGGFTEAEQNMLIGSENVTALSLGPRIVKAETAALMGLALLGPEGGL